MVLGNRSEVLFGDGYITEQLGDFFVQNIPEGFLSDKSHTDRGAV